MEDNEAFRERLSAMTPEQIAGLFEATAEAWAHLGITKDVFIGNMSAKAQYDAVIRPLELVLDAYIAMSEREEVQDAQRTYQRDLERLYALASRNRPVSEIQAEGHALKRAYDQAIAAAGDERVDAAKRVYDAAVISESRRFASRLR